MRRLVLRVLPHGGVEVGMLIGGSLVLRTLVNRILVIGGQIVVEVEFVLITVLLQRRTHFVLVRIVISLERGVLVGIHS